jgi:hypothetical protein
MYTKLIFWCLHRDVKRRHVWNWWKFLVIISQSAVLWQVGEIRGGQNRITLVRMFWINALFAMLTIPSSQSPLARQRVAYWKYSSSKIGTDVKLICPYQSLFRSIICAQGSMGCNQRKLYTIPNSK